MKLHGACIKTHNIEEMVSFYKKIFGYEPTVDGGVDFRFLDNQLIVFRLSDMAMTATKSVALIYVVDDVDLEYNRLMDLGVANDPPTNKPWGVRSFIIKDPDGNSVSFTRNLS